MTKRTFDLTGVRLKLERAREHIETLRCQTDTFIKREPAPFDFRTKRTSRPDESVDYVLYAVVREKPPPALALLIGDAIQNMRAALDHLVYELATPKGRRTKRLQFPIFTDECEFKVRGKEQISSITDDERALIERVQPYKAAHIASDDPLAILRKLSNRDKHRLLIPLITAANRRDSWVTSDNAEITITFFEPGPVKHDAQIMAFTARPQDPAKEMYVNTQSGLHIQLGNTGVATPRDEDAVEMLDFIHHHIDRFVIDRWFKYGHMPLTVAELNENT